MKIRHLITGLLIILLVVFLSILTTAQEATATPVAPAASIELTGPISSISGTTMTVNGLTIDLANAIVSGTLSSGINVKIVGYLTSVGIIVAQTVTEVRLVTPTPAGTLSTNPTQVPTEAGSTSTAPTPAATDDNSDVIIVVEGPIQNININIVTIYNINIEVDVNNPILNIIQIGDVIYVEGVLDASGVIIPSVVNNLPEAEEVADGASVGIQGPIEAINGNLITVNGITVQFDPNDPQLSNLVVGNFLDVQGNFIIINNVYILVVVNVIIINNIDITVPDYCWWHQDPMGMGHWHCDGMGMGPGMGMGE
ncbi:MAG TPA: DUF5666 domain-containing protein [Phototrophicaceae bacterium]|jgi:hypothetical protein|nr:DUF5666 domain-containing protein [Phototrophicaceae bacterium]